MCILTTEVHSVSNTHIYVSADDTNRRQMTIYSNTIDSSGSNTMILPVPNPETLEILECSHSPEFFQDVKKCFHIETIDIPCPIYKIGSYKVSLVNSVEELCNVQFEEFQITEKVLSFLKTTYKDGNFGFLLCKVDPGIHTYTPLIYTHRLHSSGQLFIPTLQYESNIWDHTIYSPATTLFSNSFRFTRSRHMEWEKFPESYKWAQFTQLDCWEKRGAWMNKDFYISHTTNPVTAAEDCSIM